MDDNELKSLAPPASSFRRGVPQGLIWLQKSAGFEKEAALSG